MRLFLHGGLCLIMSSAALAAEGANESLFAGTIAQSVAAIVVFILLMAILRKYAWKPILNGLQDREKKIADDLSKAESAAMQAQDTLKEYKTHLEQAQVEANKIIEQGKADANRIAAGLKEKTQAEVDQLRQRAQADILAAKEQALAQIYTQAATLVTGAAARVLQREISSQDHEKIINQSLEALGQHNKAS